MDFVVLSSSRGTTLQAVLDAMKHGELTAKCLGLVTDREDRGCVEKARAANVPVIVVQKEKGEDRTVYDTRVHEAILSLGATQPDGTDDVSTVIAALGWMYILSPWFVGEWKNRILNVHPALLPKFPGAHAIDEVLAAGEKESGMTIHLIDEGVDTGPIIEQKSCSVASADTSETLKMKIQELEKKYYPIVLEGIHSGTIQLPK